MMSLIRRENQKSARAAHHSIDPLFLARWSPRAFDGSALPEETLLRLFEAARWAPSSFNQQPWRFCYALRDGPHWQPFLDVLLPFNRSWVERASALVFILSEAWFADTSSGEITLRTSHAFDTGAAWAQLALQATIIGLRCHAMLGFDRDAATELLRLPGNIDIQAAVAIGREGDRSALPEKLRSREEPSGRRPLSELVFAGPLELEIR